MKKITLLFFTIFCFSFGFSQTLNQNANWPNPSWTVDGTYSTATGAFEANPTVDANFAFDDDDAGFGSDDSISAESPVIDLTPAFNAGEIWLTVSADYVYRYLADDELVFQYWDADASAWVDWGPSFDTLGTTTSIADNYCTGTPETYTSPVLDIAGFTATQQSGFRYRISYDDDPTGDDYNYGFCFHSPTITSEVPPTDLLDYYNLQFPATGNINAGEPFDVYAQAYEAGLTDVTSGQSAGIEAWIGFSTSDTDPSGDGWTWIPATFNSEVGNNDEYTLNLSASIPALGTYYYASRWRLNGGFFTYGGIQADASYGGIWGEDNNISGVLTVNPPANDDCDNAISLTVNSDLSCGDITSGTVLGASDSGLTNSTCSGTEDDDVWYSFVATSTSHQVILSNVVGSVTDMYHVVYDGAGGCGSLGAALKCSDANSSVTTDLVIGNTYYVQVYTYTGTGGQNTNFDICVGTLPPPPANDDCPGAVGLTVNSDLDCGVVTAGTTVSATASPQEDDVSGTPNNDVWFSFVAASTAHQVSLTNVVAVVGTSTDMGIGVYDGTSGCDALVFNATSDPNTLSLTGLTIGVTYYVRVYGWGSTATTAQTNFDICIGTPPPPPVNDECAGALPLTESVDSSCTNAVSGTTSWAGPSASGTCSTAGKDVWYTFTPLTTGNYNFTVSEVTDYGFSSTYVTLYSGECGTTTQIGTSCSTTSISNVALTASTIYYVVVRTTSSTTGVDFSLCAFPSPPPPANDLCADAVSLVCDAPLNGTTIDATGGSGSSCLGSIGNDVWYQYTGNDSTVDLTVLSSTANEEAQVEVYSSTDGTCSGFTLATCFESEGSGENPVLLTFNADAGTTYFIRVGNWINGNAGIDFSIEATCTPYPDCGAPTDLVASVTTTTADISWTAPVAGTPVGYNWEVQPDGVAQGTAGAIDSGTTATTSDTATGMSPETAYDLYVQTDCGADGTSDWTGPYSFTTAATPPPNDDIAGAIALTIDAAYCDGVQNNGTNVGATDSGEGVGSCFNGANADNDVWFSVTIPSNVATIDVSTDFTGGTLVDTEIAIYSGTSGALVEIDCSQDDGTTVLSNGFSWNSLMTDVPVTGGETYLIQVAGYGTSSFGTFCVEVTTNTLGVDSSELNTFTYFPNPVKSLLNLKAQSNIQNVSVYNMLGQEVLRTSPNTLNSELDMASLQTGAYFVKVTINDATETIRVIKQ